MQDLEIYQTRDGPMMAFRHDVYIGRSLELYGEFSPSERELLGQLVKPGGVVVEVGANIGAHTIALARACAPGKLYAFEPQQRVFQVLCANLALNGVTNVVALPDACGDASAFARVPPTDYAARGNFGGVSLEPDKTPGERIRVYPLDELELAACQLIKIDVEGFEPQVLRGAAETVRRCRPILYVENDRPQNQQEVLELIEGLGYRMYWHLPPLYEPENFRRSKENVFAKTVSVNVLALPNERPSNISGKPIDPKNWTDPLKRPLAPR